ncbi:hypothetical protein LCGC14_0962860 [marine sediment metagenome]|uniref:Uncharacterized protein n=1 Tax=marine sediment metagenome TaxID=412755 RepID=A0A0F9RKI5_9ZZZZ
MTATPEKLRLWFKPKSRAGACVNCKSKRTLVYASPTWGPRWFGCEECGHRWAQEGDGGSCERSNR